MAAAFSSRHAGPPGYGALIADAGAYEDRSRIVFRVLGDQALKMLHGLVTADLLTAAGNRAHPTLILTPTGKIRADAVVIHFDDVVWLDVPAAAWPGLEKHFGRYLPPRLARLERSDTRVVRVHGPRATERERTDPILASMDHPTYTERDGSHWVAARFRGGFAVRPPEGFDLYLPADAHDDLEHAADHFERARKLGVGQSLGSFAKTAYQIGQLPPAGTLTLLQPVDTVKNAFPAALAFRGGQAAIPPQPYRQLVLIAMIDKQMEQGTRQ